MTPRTKKVTVTFEFITQAETDDEVLGDIQQAIDNLDTSWMVVTHQPNFFTNITTEDIPDAPVIPDETVEPDNWKEVDEAWKAWSRKANEVMGNKSYESYISA